MGATRITPVLATSLLSGWQILRALLKKGAVALVKEPVIRYLPSSPRMGSDGRLAHLFLERQCLTEGLKLLCRVLLGIGF